MENKERKYWIDKNSEEVEREAKKRGKLIKENIKKEKEKTNTDCRSEEGITVGLIDSLISISRILGKRLEELEITPVIKEALKDFEQDKDVTNIIVKSGSETFLSRLEELRNSYK